MTRTIAEALRDEGREEGLEKGREQCLEKGREEGAIRALQQALLVSMRTKFGRIPRATEKAIRTMQDPNELQACLVRAAKAVRLQEIGVAPPSGS